MGMQRSLSVGSYNVEIGHCGRSNNPDEEPDAFFPWSVIKNFEGRKLLAALDTSMHKEKPWLKRKGRVEAIMIDPNRRPETAPPEVEKTRRRKRRAVSKEAPPRPQSVRGAFPWGRAAWVPSGTIGTGIPCTMTISRELKVTPPIGTPGLELMEENRPSTYLHPYALDRMGRTNWGGNKGQRGSASEGGVGSIFDQLRQPKCDIPLYHEEKDRRIKNVAG